MAYLKPAALTRHVANPLAMRLGARGVVTLTVVGRRTGDPRKVPVIPVEVDGNRYVVPPTASPTGSAISGLPAAAS